ncbi:MAG: PilZ domain-containing protein [Desulfuromonadales bacterium]
MRNDVYHLVTVNGGRSDNAAIVNVLSEIAAGRLESDLRLLNYYDEMPVSYSPVIVSRDRDSFELVVHKHQALIIKHDRSTLIKSRHFHNGMGVHCFAAYVSVPRKTVILHNFAYAQIRAERREAVRVKIHQKMPVTFFNERVTIEGVMADISGSGISFSSRMEPTDDINQPGILHFTLSGIPLTVPGLFIRSTAYGTGEYLYIFKLDPDRISESMVARFIYKRQVEIVQQLKDGFVVE